MTARDCMTEWIEKDDFTRVCPACGHEFDKGALYGVGDICGGLPRFCPHCGANNGEKKDV